MYVDHQKNKQTAMDTSKYTHALGLGWVIRTRFQEAYSKGLIAERSGMWGFTADGFKKHGAGIFKWLVGDVQYL